MTMTKYIYLFDIEKLKTNVITNENSIPIYIIGKATVQ